MRYAFTQDTVIGPMTLAEEADALVEARFGTYTEPGETVSLTPLLDQAFQELHAYLRGELTAFTVRLMPRGTPFQLRCWRALCDIPYGQTVSYGEQAIKTGNPRACRAVGMANHRNPLPVFIPCHRVVGKNGSLTGYGGGLHVKRALLELERQGGK